VAWHSFANSKTLLVLSAVRKVKIDACNGMTSKFHETVSFRSKDLWEYIYIYINVPGIQITAKPDHRICSPSHSGIAPQRLVTQPALHRAHQSHESRFNGQLRAVERTTSIVGTDDPVRSAVLRPALKENFMYLPYNPYKKHTVPNKSEIR
jgi:hypothetical protein